MYVVLVPQPLEGVAPRADVARLSIATREVRRAILELRLLVLEMTMF